MKLVALLLLFAFSGQQDLFAQRFSDDAEYLDFYQSYANPHYFGEDTVAFWWLVTRFSDTNWTREQLEAGFRRFAVVFPDSKHLTQSTEYSQLLAQMVEESAPKAGCEIERLIFALRDVNAVQVFQPGRCLVLSPRSDTNRLLTKQNAAEQLRELGYDCIPALIDHLDDSTLTRSVEYWRYSVYSHRVLTVGDCCKQILEEMVPSLQRFELGEDPDAAKSALKRYAAELCDAPTGNRTTR